MLDISPRRQQQTTTVAARLARWAFRLVVIALFAVACGLTLSAFYQGKKEVVVYQILSEEGISHAKYISYVALLCLHVLGMLAHR